MRQITSRKNLSPTFFSIYLPPASAYSKVFPAFFVFIAPFILLPSPCFAGENRDNLFSIDFSYTLTGMRNHGWGLGLNYEKKIADYLSVKGNLGHMTHLTGLRDVYNTTVSISLFLNYYPSSSGLDKLYISAGNGCEFMNYFGSGELPNTARDTLIHITPQLGWKFNLFEIIVIDLSSGYKFIVANTGNYRDIKDLVNPGLRFGLNFSVFFSRLKKEEADE